MGLMVEIVFLVLKVCAIASFVVLQGSSGHKIPPSPANFSADDPIIEGSPHLVIRKEQMISDPPNPTSRPNPSPHFESSSAPQVVVGREPSLSPITPLNEPPHAKEPVLSPDAAAQIAPSPEKLQLDPPPMSQEPPSMSTLPASPSNLPVPVASSPSKLPRNPLPGSSTLPVSPILPEPHVSPVLTPLPRINRGRDIVPASSSQNQRISSTPTHHSPGKAPSVLKASISYNHAPPPDSSYKSTTPAKSLPPPSLSPLYPPPPGPTSKPRHYAPSPANPGLAVPPFHTSVSPAISPFATPPSVRTTMPLASPSTAPARNLPQPHPTMAEPPSNLPVTVAAPPSKSPKEFLPIHHNSSIPPSILPEPRASPASTPLPSIDGGRDIVPVSSSPNRTTNVTPSQHIPVKAPSMHKAPSSNNHTHPNSSYVSTPPTKSHPSPSVSLLYPAPPHLKSKPRLYAPPPPNSGSAVPPSHMSVSIAISPSTTPPSIQTTTPSVHKARLPDSSFESIPPTKSHPLPPLSPLYPPLPPGPPRHHASPRPNPGSAVPPFLTSGSPAISPSATPPSIQMPLASPPTATPRNLSLPHPMTAETPSNLPAPVVAPPSTLPKKHQPIYHNSSIPPLNSPSPSVHNALSSHNHAPPDSSYESIPPTKSYTPPSLSPLYPPPPGPKSKPRHHAPPPPNPAPTVHIARPPDSSFESTPPTKSHPLPSLSPLYPPRPPGPPWHYAAPPPNPGSALPPFHTSVSPAISPSATSVQATRPFLSPKISPLRSSPSIPKPIQALPPPPPNEDCSSITCNEPLTNTPPGTPCDCVMPMQIELGLSVALYTFFPSVSELAFEVAFGVFMKPSQVRIMGANADDQDPEKTIVLIDLVPFGKRFDNFTAYQTAQRLWLKQVPIKSSLVGDYEVLYVKYPGLPPSPPSPSSNSGMYGEQDGHGNDGMTRKPMGVDVIKHRHGDKLNGRIIAIVALSAAVAAILFGVVFWLLLFKGRDGSQLETAPPDALPSFTKSSGIAASMTGSGPPTSLSCRSSIACTGSAKTFSSSDMEKATNNFNESQVLGEGGFGRVYSGLLDDGTKVAVKVLKRLGQQGGREFLAEVEMLSRLHHRNLVRLIGFCTDERNLCLVYELIPNGSVESHLYGKDKETSPLDWAARLKIALGTARGLAYLHEDSSPRVIHRDFKASNILLELDFTPKVSDFGLARTTVDEENRHITTRVMGTFGYVAPEYAMTGHLLVKSDVYSYGVVLLELLTGRKPVDMSRPPGQENLVTWAQPLIATPDGLTLLIDPMLSPDATFDSIAKVAAIASMCVQTEVSERPFMGEVVQALRLVCNECEETTDLRSTSVEFDARVYLAQSTYSNHESPLDLESGCLVPALGPDSGSYRMSSSSGPLTTGRRLV